MTCMVTALFAFGLCGSVRAGKLDDAGRTTREGGGGESSSDESDASDGDVDCDDECAEVFVNLILAPWTLPRALVGTDRQLDRWYDDYPYAGSSGYVGLRVRPWGDAEPVDTGPDPERAQRWAAQASLEGGANLDGVGRGAFGARLLMPVPLALSVEGMGFLEDDGAALDWATLTAARLEWRFAEATQVQFRTGVGMLHWYEDAEAGAEVPLSDGERSALGFDVTYGIEAFVHRPFVLSLDGRLGGIGEALTWQARGTLGAMIGVVEAYAGYHEVVVGGVHLGGPVAGVRGFL